MRTTRKVAPLVEDGAWLGLMLARNYRDLYEIAIYTWKMHRWFLRQTWALRMRLNEFGAMDWVIVALFAVELILLGFASLQALKGNIFMLAFILFLYSPFVSLFLGNVIELDRRQRNG